METACWNSIASMWRKASRTGFIVLAGLGLLQTAFADEGWWLITPEEYALLQAQAGVTPGYAFTGEQASPLRETGKRKESTSVSESLQCDAVAGPPRIEIRDPREGPAITSPFRVEVRFCAEAGVPVRADTLKIYYKLGLVTKDITERVKEKAEVSATGISAKNVEFPAGSHRILIRIQDERGRIAEREALFRVETT